MNCNLFFDCKHDSFYIELTHSYSSYYAHLVSPYNAIPYEIFVGNVQDFYNLVDVYLDAVFYPRCVNDIHTFQQEGWHYELNDPAEDITFKGKMF